MPAKEQFTLADVTRSELGSCEPQGTETNLMTGVFGMNYVPITSGEGGNGKVMMGAAFIETENS